MYLILDENERKKTRVRNEKKFTKKKSINSLYYTFQKNCGKNVLLG